MDAKEIFAECTALAETAASPHFGNDAHEVATAVARLVSVVRDMHNLLTGPHDAPTPAVAEPVAQSRYME